MNLTHKAPTSSYANRNLISSMHCSLCSSGRILLPALRRSTNPPCGTRITAQDSLDSSLKQSYSLLPSPMAFHQAHSPMLKSQSKLAACLSLFFSPRSWSPSHPEGSMQMKSPHPCLGMATPNLMLCKHPVQNQAMARSLSHPTVKVQTLSGRLSSRKRTRKTRHGLRRGFKPRVTGSRMAPFSNSTLSCAASPNMLACTSALPADSYYFPGAFSA